MRARKRRHRETADGEPFVAARDALVRGRARPRPLAPRLPPGQAARPHRRRGSGKSRSSSACSTTARASAATCSGTSTENAEALVHGLSQAFQKRGLPRALLTDNGAAMLAAETVEGLERLGIVHYTTLPYSPEQNGKQESFWGQVEGRLMPMLEGEPELILDLLNTATQAWVEQEYHRKDHSRDPARRPSSATSRARRRPREPQLRGAPARLPHGGLAQAATQRRHRHRRGRALRGPLAPTARSCSSGSASRAGTSPASTSSTRARATTSRRCLPLDKAKNAERVRRVVAPRPRRRARATPSASRRSCARSWPTTPPPACRPPTCPRHDATDDPPEDS